ncbi:unnamed protein product, partial [Amoebophrya sp. A25]|eukprot:GSA25T00019754001.1
MDPPHLQLSGRGRGGTVAGVNAVAPASSHNTVTSKTSSLESFVLEESGSTSGGSSHPSSHPM